MSPREQIQQQIVTYLNNHSEFFNAPYGVLDGMDNVGRGKVRTITFGIARLLDAHIKIWSATRIDVDGSGPLEHKLTDTYSSVEDLITALDGMRGA